jgi:outer membrane receptor protein involved in Fe transport
VAAPQAARQVSANLFGEVGQSLLSLQRRVGAAPNADIVFGLEAGTRVTTDAGSLLGKSPSILGVGVQRRTPIVSDPRIRGSRVGQLAASGSYWLPARIDLDTILSKIDSRIIDDITVIKGPYSARYGPGFDFVDVQLAQSPRYENGFQSHGSTSVDYQVNGQQWYGRQSLWGGGSDWGFRTGYGHRTGNDYVSGDGTEIPSSYKSRDIDLALGADLTADSSLEFNALRLDQTDVEYPGQAFDMDYLVTDGYDLEYALQDTPYFDRLVISAWYNRTRFAGNAQAPGKRRQFPFFDLINYQGFTDADLRSTGYSAAVTRGEDGDPQLTAGVDLRHVNQELNEISSGRIGFNVFQDANSPIPKSRSTNPGIFLEHVRPLSDRVQVTCGARVDWVAANVIDDPAKLSQLGLQQPQSSLAEILGSGEFAQSFTPWSVYVTGTYEPCPHWNLTAAAGRAVRPPSLTELYASETFLFLLQNGQNVVTGDPQLRSERLWQLDLGMSCEYDRFRAGVNGFYGWINDYITYENIGVYRGPPANQVEQVILKYVNTDLATLAGFEFYTEYDANRWLTPFATLKYIEGRDLTRNGDFATRRASPGQPSQQVPGLARGFYSGVGGPSAEPLPSILPLESRLGLRLHQACPEPSWGLEFSARFVADQNRIATSLMETRTPGFTLFDLRGFWRASDHLLCIAGVENFSDRNYREHLDFRSENGISLLQPGINFYFGSELTY